MRQAHNEEVTVLELRDTIMNFIIAGRDTTACALSWQFWLLTQVRCAPCGCGGVH